MRKKLLRVATYARQRKVCRQTIYNWMNQGHDGQGQKLRAKEFGGMTFVELTIKG